MKHNKGINSDPLQHAFYVLLRMFAHKNRAITGRLSRRYLSGELKLDSSSDCQWFQTGLIFSQQHRPSPTDITDQTGFKKAMEGNSP